MANWMELKTKMRSDVHRRFKRPALYRSISEGFTRPVNIRVHENLELVGDLENQGYGQVADLGHRVIFDASEIDKLATGDRIELQDSTDVFRIEVVEPKEGPFELIAICKKVST